MLEARNMISQLHTWFGPAAWKSYGLASVREGLLRPPSVQLVGFTQHPIKLDSEAM